MDTWIVFVLLLLTLAVGGLIGYLVAAIRAARAAGDVHARAVAAEARAEVLAASIADLREHEDETDDVLRALSSVRSSLEQIGSQVATLERERISQFGALRQQMEDAALGTAELQRTTAGLSSALRSTSARGTWGEVQLRRVLEAAGMLRHVDFQEQATLSDGGRPDVLIRVVAASPSTPKCLLTRTSRPSPSSRRGRRRPGGSPRSERTTREPFVPTWRHS